MKFLLDTNILLPILKDELDGIPRHIIAVLENEIEDCTGTAASLWEIAIKYRLGKLDLPCREEELPAAFAQMDLPMLPISSAHTVRTVEPWPDTKDPFDRIMLSICAVEGLRLLTTDKHLKNHPLAWRA